MDELLDDPGSCHALEVQAGLAQLDAVALDVPDAKSLADQIVQPGSAYRELAPGGAREQPDFRDDVPLHERQRLPGLGALLAEVAVAFEPFPGDVYRIPFAYCYRCAFSLKYPSCEVHCARHLEDVFRRVVAAESVAAVIVEPVLGEGGFIVPPQEYLGILAAICRRNNIVFIADEVQTGFGRTGALFASERYGIEPDMIVTAKSLGGGLPLAGITGRAEIMDAPGSGALGGTFGGNPVACAAALAVIEEFEKGDLSDRANKLGQRFHDRARAWQTRWPMIGDVRGLGGMQAMELVRDSREPAEEETKQVIKFCYEHGLLVLSDSATGVVATLHGC